MGDELEGALKAGKWFNRVKGSSFPSAHEGELGRLKTLEKKYSALIEYLNLEEVYVPKQDSTYTFKKKTKQSK